MFIGLFPLAGGSVDEVGYDGREAHAERVGEEVHPVAGAVCGEVGLCEFHEASHDDGKNASRGDGAQRIGFFVCPPVFKPNERADGTIHAEMHEFVEPGEKVNGGRLHAVHAQIPHCGNADERERIPFYIVKHERRFNVRMTKYANVQM